MSDTGVIVMLSPCDCDAVLFDLDGVVTPTASVHAAARRKLFDASIQRAGAGWNAEQTVIANGIEVTGRLESGWPVKVPVRLRRFSYVIEGLRASDRRPAEAHTERAESRGLPLSAVDGSP